MASSPFYFLFTVIFVATSTMVTANVPAILPVCKTVGGGNRFFSVQFCLGALGSDGRSTNAGMNYRTHSLIAVDLLTANATSTAAKIDALIRVGGGRDDATARCLRSCLALYSGILQRQPGCKGAIQEKRDKKAMSSLEESASAAKECEDGFGKSNATSPVTAENDDAFKLAKLSVALVSGADGL